MEVNERPGVFTDILQTASWMMVFSGVLAVLFGIAAVVWPGITLAVLVVLFGVYALADGILTIIAAFTTKHYWPLLLFGLLSIAAGIVAFVYPGITVLALFVVIAVWAIFRGVLEIVAAIREPAATQARGWLVFAGVLSILFGIVLLAYPLIGLLALAWLIGFYAILFGIVQIWYGVDAYSVGTRTRGALQH